MTHSLGAHLGFGIDFGTTNSIAVVALEDGDVSPIWTDAGDPHPCVVWYSPEGVVVGPEAKANINGFADAMGHRFIKSIKQELGKDREFELLGTRLKAWEVAAEVFRYLRRQATDRNPDWDIEHAVVTVPITFDGRARRDIRKAARAAGLEIENFIHEPFAALIGYYAARGQALDALPDERVLVFDWGGGTLDISITQTSDGRIEELTTSGLRQIAGDHFDEVVRNWARDGHLSRYGLSPESFQLPGGLLDRFTERSEQAKIALSKDQEGIVFLNFGGAVGGSGSDLRETLSRAEFEALIAKDIDLAISGIYDALSQARLESTDIDKVLLIGGSSEIPLLQQRMFTLFGTRAIAVDRSQSVIAEGAAVISRDGLQPFLTRPIQVQLADHTYYTIFPKDTVPTADPTRSVTLFCTDNRDGEARLLISEESGRMGSNERRALAALGTIVPPNLPAPYEHERVYATFTIDEDLVLKVQAHGASQRQVSEIEIHDLKFGLRVRP